VNEDGENRKGPKQGSELTGIQEAILRYLDRHPESCDTAVGVARWWLPRHGIETSLEQVRAALADLVRQGQLDTVDRPGGDTHYVSARRDGDRSE
jgi:hypothetical protein